MQRSEIEQSIKKQRAKLTLRTTSSSDASASAIKEGLRASKTNAFLPEEPDAMFASSNNSCSTVVGELVELSQKLTMEARQRLI